MKSMIKLYMGVLAGVLVAVMPQPSTAATSETIGP